MGLASMNEANFEKMLREKGGTDFILNGDAGLKKMMIPIIKADVVLEERYKYDSGRLQCPVLVFHGEKDGHDKMKSRVSKEDANSWLSCTACRSVSSVETLPSDWYIFQDPVATE